MITLTLNGLTPREDITNSRLYFSKDYVTAGNIPCHGGDILTYPEAMSIFAALKLPQQASALAKRVKELSPCTAEVEHKVKKASASINHKDYVAVQKEILGTDLYGFKIQLAGERYQDHPFDQLFCELVARERGVEYSPPTLDQFHRHVAKHLAKFTAPFKYSEHLISQNDLRKLYLQHLDIRLIIAGPLEAPFLTLERYIAEEANTPDVALRLLTAHEFKAIYASSCMCTSCTIFLELRIESQVCYIEFHGQDDAFRFIPAQYNPKP